MLQEGFEPTSPVSERTRAVYALDRAATVIGSIIVMQPVIIYDFAKKYFLNSDVN
jgi:hypothetical protein